VTDLAHLPGALSQAGIGRAFGPHKFVRTSSGDYIVTLVGLPCPGSLVYGLFCPRPCTRRKKQRRRERGRPQPHQRDDRPYDPLGPRKSGARTFTGWGCTNNVAVPMSASTGFLRRLPKPRIRTRGNLRTTPQSGSKTQTTSLSLYCDLTRTDSRRPYRCDGLTGSKGSRYGEGDQARSVRIFANMSDFSI